MHVLILAAGRSTRFLRASEPDDHPTTITKLLVPFLGLPLIQHVLDRALSLVDRNLAEGVLVAVSDDPVGTALEEFLKAEARNSDRFAEDTIGIIRVPPPITGTASTVYATIKASGIRSGTLLILVADTPLVPFDDLSRLVQAYAIKPPNTSGILLGVMHHHPEQYGKLITRTQNGVALPILRRIARRTRPTNSVALVNAGAVIVDVRYLSRSLGKLTRRARADRGRKLEVSLNDLPSELHANHWPMLVLETKDYLGTTGIDTQADLETLEAMVGNAQMSSTIRDAYEAETRSRIQRQLETDLREGFGLSPTHAIDQTGIEGYIISKPLGAELGGDCFVAASMAADRLCYLIADGRGHGINGALNMIPVLTGFHMYYRESGSTKHVLWKISELCSADSFQAQASALYIILDRPERSGRRKMFASSAGHPQMLVIDEDATVRAFPPAEANQGLLGSSLGISIEEATCLVSPGDLIVGFTDGVSEAVTPDGAIFGQAGVVQAVLSAHQRATKEIAETVLQAAERFAGGELSDDATIMVLRVRQTVP